jgi:hypothetical protein
LGGVFFVESDSAIGCYEYLGSVLTTEGWLKLGELSTALLVWSAD